MRRPAPIAWSPIDLATALDRAAIQLQRESARIFLAMQAIRGAADRIRAGVDAPALNAGGPGRRR